VQECAIKEEMAQGDRDRLRARVDELTVRLEALPSSFSSVFFFSSACSFVAFSLQTALEESHDAIASSQAALQVYSRNDLNWLLIACSISSAPDID
jgi:hypothetical protein